MAANVILELFFIYITTTVYCSTYISNAINTRFFRVQTAKTSDSPDNKILLDLAIIFCSGGEAVRSNAALGVPRLVATIRSVQQSSAAAAAAADDGEP